MRLRKTNWQALWTRCSKLQLFCVETSQFGWYFGVVKPRKKHTTKYHEIHWIYAFSGNLLNSDIHPDIHMDIAIVSVYLSIDPSAWKRKGDWKHTMILLLHCHGKGCLQCRVQETINLVQCWQFQTWYYGLRATVHTRSRWRKAVVIDGVPLRFRWLRNAVIDRCASVGIRGTFPVKHP